jgi:hypothetical protein
LLFGLYETALEVRRASGPNVLIDDRRHVKPNELALSSGCYRQSHLIESNGLPDRAFADGGAQAMAGRNTSLQ